MSGAPSRNNNNNNHNHPPSRHYFGRPTEEDDLTWLDYLRTAGGTVRDDPHPPQQQLDRTDSAERKRRHTGSEPQRRTHPHPYHTCNNNRPTHRPTYNTQPATSAFLDYGQPARAAAGSTMANAIDLTSPPRQAPRPAPRPAGPGTSLISTMLSNERQSNASSRESNVTVPRWQPDHEVSACTVCNVHFSMLFRRHHCRKCGRVVCSNCSPHRITIPREYIVHPPNPFGEDEASSPNSPSDNVALGGGEVVRVCNPCVPDPWHPHASNLPAAAAIASGQATYHRDPTPRSYVGYYPPAGGRHRAQTADFGSAPQDDRDLRRPSLDTPGTARLGRSPLLSPGTSERMTRNGGYAGEELFPSSQLPGFRRPSLQLASPPPTRAPPPPPAPSQQRPQREVNEEDICPVCYGQMPPGEAAHEQHIEACIASHFSSSSSAPQSRSAPPTSAAVAAAPPSREASSNTPEGSRPRAASHRPRGMLLFTATEKDCVTASGEAQECVICLEDFEEGDEMGRMECLCKFHRKCIRQWWETKNDKGESRMGTCPTHQSPYG